MNRSSPIVAAALAFQRNQFEPAERLCRELLSAQPDSAEALHLLGLVRRARGDENEAFQLLKRSVDLAPRNVEFRVNYANALRDNRRSGDAALQLQAALAIDSGSRIARLSLGRILNRLDNAAAALREADVLILANPEDSEALVVQAVALRALGRLDDALAIYEKVLTLRPDYVVAQHNFGALLCEMQQGERALDALARARRLGLDSVELEYNTASAQFILQDFTAAERALQVATRRQPEYLDAQRLLAKLRFMRGDRDYTRNLEAAVRKSNQPALAVALGELLLQGERHDEAAELLQALVQKYPASAEIASSLAVIHQARGDLGSAARLARQAHALNPDSGNIVENLVAILLQLGATDEAIPLISRQRALHPHDQRWLSYQATAARLQGTSDHEWLFDYDRFIGVFDLEPPAGFASIDEFHAQLLPVLEAMHCFNSHPLDQSLRHGTQTSRDLRHCDDPSLRAFFASIDAILRRYLAHLGYDGSHPFLERNCGSHELAGSWSVRLSSGGYHVNHIHPRGWVSSAYYVQVPAEANDEKQRRGWLKFGEPRHATPGADPEFFVQPEPGRLVLFPSYMWHGTVPIHETVARLAIAFDVLPGATDLPPAAA